METNAATLIPFRDPAPSAQILDEQLPQGEDVTSVAGAPAPILLHQGRPLGTEVQSYPLRPQQELPAAGDSFS